jgi:hypothetical protein
LNPSAPADPEQKRKASNALADYSGSTGACPASTGDHLPAAASITESGTTCCLVPTTFLKGTISFRFAWQTGIGKPCLNLERINYIWPTAGTHKLPLWPVSANNQTSPPPSTLPMERKREGPTRWSLLHCQRRSPVATLWRKVHQLWRPERAKPIALTSAAGCSFSDLPAKVGVIRIVHVQPSCSACLADISLIDHGPMGDSRTVFHESRMSCSISPANLEMAAGAAHRRFPIFIFPSLFSSSTPVTPGWRAKRKAMLVAFGWLIDSLPIRPATPTLR